MIDPQRLMLGPSGWVPNNSRLPVLIYRQVFGGDTNRANRMVDAFSGNGWQGIWRNGVFSYQHYHSEAHEVLGFADGSARLLIGGPEGETLDVAAGDVVVLPAGTGHCRLQSSADFLVIGAYPPGQEADMCTGPENKTEKEAAIAHVALPDMDPLYGAGGPLVVHWRQGGGQ
ncbi:cupin [Metarhizobium album]|uniref:Cupin n=1 Tax=Metarhizobium album TaxID=2182425 RepID=A0A2U2DKL9_9HYPH|nr:cupin [Rhizobium album]PWE53857.1 cupin [Rhizobium album]